MVGALALAGGACGGDDGSATDDAVVSTTESNGAADSSGTDSGDLVEAGYIESDQNSETTIDDDSGDDNGDETVADESNDSTSDDGTLRDETIERLIGVGLTEVQAICIVDNVPDLEEFVRVGESDPMMFLSLVEPCGIDLTQLTPPTT